MRWLAAQLRTTFCRAICGLLLIAAVFISAFPHEHFEFAHFNEARIDESETNDVHEHLTEKVLKTLLLHSPAIIQFEKAIISDRFVLLPAENNSLHWRPPLLFFAAPRDPPAVSII